MLTFTILSLALTVVLGLSVVALVISYLRGYLEKIIGYFLVCLLGMVLSAIIVVLVVIAIWPPVNLISFVLPIGFVVVVAGAIKFVRSTYHEKSTGVKPNQRQGNDTLQRIYVPYA